MSYDPQYKTIRQEPACDAIRNQHKTGKRKVWRFKSEWLPEKRFIVRKRLSIGKWEDKSYTLEEALNNECAYFVKFGPRRPLQKFKTREDALKSWQSMKQKKEVGNRGCKYWLENTDSGEIVNLSHIT